jgi:flavin reductase (DIM6/NTAB) family NADH-FMN oxidoreductase RutF
MTTMADVPDAQASQAFEALVGHLDYPMFVVTTASQGRRAGCLVGFASQVSINPPRFLVGLSRNNYTLRVARDAARLAVHVLRRSDLELARLFGEQTGDQVDKFAQCEWAPGPDGVPILSAAPAWFSGLIQDRMRLGDHFAYLLTPDSGRASSPLSELITFADVQDFKPGHDA